MLSGVLTLLLTPFDEKGEVEFGDIKRLISYYQDSMVDGLVCLGDASESQFLNDDEKSRIVETTINVSKGLPVIAGISGQTADEVVNSLEELPQKGLSGYLIPPPRDPGMSGDKIIDFYSSIDRHTDLPIIILDNPQTIRPVISPEHIVEIVRKTQNVRYLKVEDQPTASKIEKLNSLGERNLAIFGASHGRNFFWELERGVSGILTSTPLPKILVSVWKAYSEGKTELARDLFLKSLPLAYFFPEYPVAVKKEVLKYLKVIGSSKTRKDAPILSQKSMKDLVDILEWTDLNMDGLLNLSH